MVTPCDFFILLLVFLRTVVINSLRNTGNRLGLTTEFIMGGLEPFVFKIDKTPEMMK